MPSLRLLLLCATFAAAIGALGIGLWVNADRVARDIDAKFSRFQVALEHVVKQDEFLNVTKAEGMSCKVEGTDRAEAHCQWSPKDRLAWLHAPQGIWIDAEFIDGRKVTAYKVERRQ